MNEEKVTIVIVTYNAFDYVKRCLKSVIVNTHEIHQIIVVDNNSDKNTQDFLINLENDKKIKLVLNKSNRLWSPANNQGLKISDEDSKYCLLLNSDVEILKDSWIYELQKPMKEKTIGISGTQYNFSPIKPTYGGIDGCCFMFKKFLLNKIGYLDENYPWNGAGFIFIVSAWEKGWYYYHVNDPSILIHYGKKSRKDNNLNLKNVSVDKYDIIREFNLIPKYNFIANFKYKLGFFNINNYIKRKRNNY